MNRVEGIETVRRILCVFPRYTSSFGTFEYAYPLTDGVSAFMPPQGLLLIAAYLPENWPVRFIDENLRPATKEDFEWAEAVFVSGMHIQRQQMNDICRRAHAFDLAVAIGGPSVSACPDYYPSFDYLHVGELGDATNELIRRLADDPSRPEQQVVLKTADRVPMSDFPIPAYELAEVKKYFLGSIQYSSGCPYQCEFCDIPGLYGRNPRLKTPQQIIAELDKLRECGVTGSVYFVDDNFIGNRKAALDLLPHLVEWQKRTGYVMRLACEATLNIAKRPEILEKMRDAHLLQNLGPLGDVECRLAGQPHHVAGPLLPLDQMRQQVKRRLAIADEIVVDEIHRVGDAAFAQFVEFGDDLLRRFQARIAAVEAGDVAELALIGAAARILDAAEEIFFDLGQLVGRNRKLASSHAIGGLQHHLLLGARRIARQTRDQFVGGIAEFADMEIVERGIIIRTGADRRPADRDRQIEVMGAAADVVHLLALDVHAADEHRFRPLEIFLAWRGGCSRR